MPKKKMEKAYMLVEVSFAGTVEQDEFVKDDKWYTQVRPLTLEDFSGDFTFDQDKAIAEVLEELVNDNTWANVTESDISASVLGFYKTRPRNKLY